MLHLLWGLLNVAILISFFSVSVLAIKPIRQRLGIIPAVIFVLGILALVSGSKAYDGNREPGPNQIKTWKFTSRDSLDKGPNAFASVNLEETLVSTYELNFEHGKKRGSVVNIPLSATTGEVGFVSGRSWKPTSIILNPTNDNKKFEYQVDGFIKWNVLTLTLYSQPKSWKGMAILK